MTTPFLKKLAELDEGATEAPWQNGPLYFGTSQGELSEIIGRGPEIDMALVCLLRNNSKAIRELVEAVTFLAEEHLQDYGHGTVGTFDAEEHGWPEESAWVRTIRALANFKGE